ncbi:hypothetical protein LGR54_11740 [Ancylobacter sp. Lp-2]|uniref:hypothetical protein n=1 Tax=Ancylobacter sp. Lp-2 TaxID=2881339 RepID=UPI001E50200F|nr:hypothetical protein [Ancylobacter sp. Lp-2]MCB4769278.1 hypothetical protein [Ancylobacter sp. Lp-2]
MSSMTRVSGRKARRAALALAALSLALATAGCGSMDIDKLNPFQEREKKLPGARSAVFPEGVPGVDYNAAPQQPANSGYDYSASTAASPSATGETATSTSAAKPTQ